MNEKFLYRAKCIDADRWVEGNLLIDTCGCFICADLCINNRKYKDRHYGYEIMEIRAFEIDPSTICQCTGLKDKNGKLIWENDIVSGKMYLDHGQWGESVDDKRIVEWDDDYARFIPCSYMKLDKYEVIGNIFDNPELLEVGE